MYYSGTNILAYAKDQWLNSIFKHKIKDMHQYNTHQILNFNINNPVVVHPKQA